MVIQSQLVRILRVVKKRECMKYRVETRRGDAVRTESHNQRDQIMLDVETLSVREVSTLCCSLLRRICLSSTNAIFLVYPGRLCVCVCRPDCITLSVCLFVFCLPVTENIMYKKDVSLHPHFSE